MSALRERRSDRLKLTKAERLDVSDIDVHRAIDRNHKSIQSFFQALPKLFLPVLEIPSP
jgi:hypothetical protein